ncbi:MAG TPA: hypothetical protein VEX86_22530 [Longimicrobium sp.]|nr:hypothetical protein [Longimicrobium sp.]
MRSIHVFLLALCMTAGACTSWRMQPGPAPEAVARLNGTGTVRVTRRDMSVIVMSNPQVVGDSIVGMAGDPPVRAAVASSDVQRIDARRVSATKTGGLAIGTVAIISVVAIAAAVAALLGDWN